MTPRKPVERPGGTWVAIVSNNPETLDGLKHYFGQTGIASHCTSAVRDLAAVAPARATAAVIFPDDFDERDVLELLRALRRHRPDVLALLVTRDPNRFRPAVEADGHPLPPILLPRPSFGWEIVDVIRAHRRPDGAG